MLPLPQLLAILPDRALPAPILLRLFRHEDIYDNSCHIPGGNR